MFETIRADIDRKVRGYGVRPQDKTFFRKRITPLLELGTLAVIVYRFGRWVYSIKIPVLRQLMIGIYLVTNTICLMLTGIHIQRESDIGPGLVVHNCSCIFVLAKRIGHSCTVNQGVSVASIRGTGWPTIGTAAPKPAMSPSLTRKILHHSWRPIRWIAKCLGWRREKPCAWYHDAGSRARL